MFVVAKIETKIIEVAKVKIEMKVETEMIVEYI